MKLLDDNNPPKLAALVSTAQELFYKYGIKRVSIEEICNKAGVSKMTFYKHFSNKIELLKFILTKLYDASIHDFEALAEQKVPFSEKVRLILELKEQYTHALSREMLEDLIVHPHPDIQEIIEQQKKRSFELVYNLFKSAQEKGEIRRGVKLEFLMFMLNHLMELGKNPELIGMYETGQDLAMELTNFIFYGMLPARS